MAHYNLLAVPVIDAERPARRASSPSTTRSTRSCPTPGGSGSPASPAGQRDRRRGRTCRGLPGGPRRGRGPDRVGGLASDLRGRFRGRRGLLAFLAVMGPGIIAGIAGNDAGGITTYSVLGAKTGLDLLWLLPGHDRHPAIVQEIAARLGVVDRARA